MVSPVRQYCGNADQQAGCEDPQIPVFWTGLWLMPLIKPGMAMAIEVMMKAVIR